MLDVLLSQNLPAIEWAAVILALIYVVLAARNSAWCWPFAVVSSVLWSYQVWYSYSLLFDALLNAFYAVMGVVGLWRWVTTNADDADDATAQGITSIAMSTHGKLIAGGALASLVLIYVSINYLMVAMPIPDVITTVYSVIGTFLLIDRKLESWLYLLVMDVVYVWLYWDRGSVLFAGVFVLYCVLATAGYLNWRKLMRSESIRALNYPSV